METWTKNIKWGGDVLGRTTQEKDLGIYIYIYIYIYIKHFAVIFHITCQLFSNVLLDFS